MSGEYSLPAGVYSAVRKDGTKYYRASLTYRAKHISLGSFESPDAAHAAYECANNLLRGEASDKGIIDYSDDSPVDFSKWVAIINIRDNGIYCSGPIYLRNKYFEYYLDADTVLRFDASELFYYTHHSIQRRGGHLFVADYGSQVNILSRYGIRSFAVSGRDYTFRNGDKLDFRSGNVVIINRFMGVRSAVSKGKTEYITRIHVNGDLVVGHYSDELDAAIAYNKAADLLEAAGVRDNFNRNYLEDMSTAEYRIRYQKVKISKRLPIFSR